MSLNLSWNNNQWTCECRQVPSGSSQICTLSNYSLWIPEQLRLAGPAGPLWPTSVPAGTPRAGGPGPWTGSFWTCPRRRPHSLRATCSSSQRSEGVPVLQLLPIASCPGTRHHWKKLGSIFLALTLQVPIDIDEIPWSFSLPGWTAPAPSASPHRNAPDPSSSWWPYTGLFPAYPDLPWSEGPRTEPSIPSVVSLVPSREEIRGNKMKTWWYSIQFPFWHDGFMSVDV